MKSVLSFVVVALLHAGVAQAASLVVEVTPRGTVKYNGACVVDVLGSDGASVVADARPDQELPLSPGKYALSVTCPSTEGPLRKVIALTMGARDEKRSVTLDPGFVWVNVKRWDSPVAAEVTILDEAGHVLATTKERMVVPVVAGRVRVVAKVFDKKAARPVTGNANATVVAGKKSEIVLDTTDGELTLLLTNNNVATHGVGHLRLPGDATHLVELRSGNKTAVPPGTYELVTQIDEAHDLVEVVTRGIVIVPQRAQQKAVNHRTVRVPVRVLVGRRPPEGMSIDVELYRSDETTPYNTVAYGEPLVLSPGEVSIGVRRTDARLDDGAQLADRRRVNVKPGTTLQFELDAARLDVKTTVGKKSQAIAVTLRTTEKEGGTVMAQKQSADDGKASFTVRPGRYVIAAVLKAPQGEVATEKTITLKSGPAQQVSLDLDVGTAMLQVFEGGVAVPAEVRFFDNVNASEPMLAVPSGQEALLPPGTYRVVIRRKGKETTVDDVKVAAGAVYERTVELSR